MIKEIENINSALPHIAFDQDATKACKANNEEVLKEETKDPKQGGNIEHFKKILGEKAKTPDAEEFTFVQWVGTAHDLVILNLLQEYEKSTNEKKPALLDTKTVKVGMSFKPHKKSQNIFQIIYVKQSTNLMA